MRFLRSLVPAAGCAIVCVAFVVRLQKPDDQLDRPIFVKAVAGKEKPPQKSYEGDIPANGPAELTLLVHMECHGKCVFEAIQALKGLPWADHDNYRIDFDEQTVTVRVTDMRRFDQQQLIESFSARELVPMWLEEIKPLSDVPAVAMDVLSNESYRALTGDWRTDESAERKFWLAIREGMIRLHTTKIGFWTSSTFPIRSVGSEMITCAAGENTFNVTYQKHPNGLAVQIASPSDFQGEFTLYREGQNDK